MNAGANEIVDRLIELAGGHAPADVTECIHMLGGLGLAVRSVDLGPGFQGALRGGEVLVPAGCSADCATEVMRHEAAEHAVRGVRHAVANQVAHLLRPPTELTREPFYDDLPAAEPTPSLGFGGS